MMFMARGEQCTTVVTCRRELSASDFSPWFAPNHDLRSIDYV